MIPALAVAAALLLAAALPGPWRGPARALLSFALILSPVIALGFWIPTWNRGNPATWFLLVPVAFVWLTFFDLRCGVTARLARPPARAAPRLREAPPIVDDEDDAA